jgi:3'-phosphoadenosine 5'-phosphosulfate sulfotransferase (PAPS reductase)/FAD synthetase
MSERVELIPSGELVQQVRDQVDDLLLYFSCGKDSIAMWLWLREVAPGLRIWPVYLYTVPGLRSDAENLAYYERFFGQHIMRFPHPLFYQMLNDLVYQPPERVAQILAFDLPDFKFADLDRVIAQGYLAGRSYYAAMGMRMADNLDRRMMMYQNGVLGTKHRRFYYPIWDWSLAQVSAIIRKNQAKLPRAYQFAGRTIAAIDYYYMRPFRQAYPDDYARILEWFPLLEAEFYRYERLANG